MLTTLAFFAVLFLLTIVVIGLKGKSRGTSRRKRSSTTSGSIFKEPKRRRTRDIFKNSSGGSVFGVDKRTRGGKMAMFSPGRTEGRKRR